MPFTSSYFPDRSKIPFLQLSCFDVLLHLKYEVPLCEPEIEFNKLAGGKALAIDHCVNWEKDGSLFRKRANETQERKQPHRNSLNVATGKKKSLKKLFRHLNAYKRRYHRVGMKHNFYLRSFTTHCLSHCITELNSNDKV